jgi:hypothetical protein
MRLRYSFAMGMDSPSNIAEALAYYIWVTGDPESINRGYAMYEKVTPQDIMNVAKKYYVTTGLTPKFISSGFTPIVGSNVHNFSSPFFWDGTSNLVVDICFDNDAAGTCSGGSGVCFSSSASTKFTTTSFVSVRGNYGNNSTGIRDMCAGTTGDSVVSFARPNITISGETDIPPKKFDKRKSPSVDKNGNRGDGVVSNDPNDADFIDSTGMGWFPGYAINVETGERLNIAFGENSSLVGENSTDMLFNPTSNQGVDDNGRLSFGGMHYIYVFNKNGTGTTDVPIYDFGAKIDELVGAGSSVGKRNAFKDCIWATIPILASGQTLLSSDAKIRLRTHREYRKFLSTGDVATNGTNPLYEIEVDGGFEALTNQSGVATSALDNIRVVPNPYYAYSSYERTRKDQLDNRVRITNLPSKCTVSIYTMNGVLVRQLRRSVLADESQGEETIKGLDFNLAKTLDWDLKNTAGITVASGVYIIHIDAGEIGEKIIKWFGIMRPIDLDSF